MNKFLFIPKTFTTFAVRMKRIGYILAFLVLCNVTILAQSAARADELFLAQQYVAALDQYAGLLKYYPQNTLYQYRYARCLQETGKTHEAIHWFEVAGEKYALRNFYLALLYTKTYQAEEAIVAAEKYLSTIDPTAERYATADSVLQYAKKCSRYLRRVEDLVVLDSVILEKKAFLKAYRLSEDCGSLSMDTSGVVFTSSRGDKKMLTVSNEEQNSVIVTCQRLLDEWSGCDTLPEPVNMTHNTAYPYLLSDGVTLYFSSDSPDGLGGYDLYQTRYNPSQEVWLTPENLGFPFNSPRNDYMLAIDEQAGVGYFATDRRTSDDSVAVYSFLINDEKIILRDATQEYVRRAAQLLDFRKEKPVQIEVDTINDEPIQAVNESEQVASSDSIFSIVINDSTIYTSLGQFLSEEARAFATEYVELCQQIEEEILSLREMRESFATAETEERKSELRPVILTQEKTLRTLCKERKQLLKAVVNAEH